MSHTRLKYAKFLKFKWKFRVIVQSEKPFRVHLAKYKAEWEFTLNKVNSKKSISKVIIKMQITDVVDGTTAFTS